jgi:hypothetical protein
MQDAVRQFADGETRGTTPMEIKYLVDTYQQHITELDRSLSPEMKMNRKFFKLCAFTPVREKENN